MISVRVVYAVGGPFLCGLLLYFMVDDALHGRAWMAALNGVLFGLNLVLLVVQLVKWGSER